VDTGSREENALSRKFRARVLISIAALALGARMKKPKIEAEEQQPRKIIRADKAPTEGYSLVVDGHFKSHHDTLEAAEEVGTALKNQYQMLQVQIYDAATKTRSLIDWPAQS
jgi:hypothetical protein